jgi:hypothetical protein
MSLTLILTFVRTPRAPPANTSVGEYVTTAVPLTPFTPETAVDVVVVVVIVSVYMTAYACGANVTFVNASLAAASVAVNATMSL